jgi:hypothetical protein
MLGGRQSNALIVEVMVANSMQSYSYSLKTSGRFQTLVRAYSANAPPNPSLSPIPSPAAGDPNTPLCPHPNVCVLPAKDPAGGADKIKLSVYGKKGKYAAIGWGGSGGMAGSDILVSLRIAP